MMFRKKSILFIILISFINCFQSWRYTSKIDLTKIDTNEKPKVYNINDTTDSRDDEFFVYWRTGFSEKHYNGYLIKDPNSKFTVSFKEDYNCSGGEVATFFLSMMSLFVIPSIDNKCEYLYLSKIEYNKKEIYSVSTSSTSFHLLSHTLAIFAIPLQLVWNLAGDPKGVKATDEIKKELVALTAKELIQISKLSEAEIKTKYLDPLEKKDSSYSISTPGFSDSLTLKNGQTITNVKTKIAGDSVVVDYPDGSTKVFKKTQVKAVNRN